MRSALAGLAVALSFAVAAAADELPADPLDALRGDMAQQDRMVDEGKADAAVAAARERAKDGTAEGFYLLGRALGNLAVTRAEAKETAEADRLLDEARESFERSKEAGGLLYAPAHLGMARVARFKGDFDAAIAELRTALRISKGFRAAVLELAQTFWEKKLPGDAEYVLYQFLADRPADAEARLMLGMLKLQRKRFAEAEPEFRKVLSSDPAHKGARKFLAADLMYQEKYADSAEQWEILRRADPKDDEPYLTLVPIYRKLKKKEEAVAVLNDLARELPGTEPARRAKALLEQLRVDPASWDAPEEDSPEALVRRLDSPDAAVVQRTLEQMRGYKWPALPARVYQLLLRDGGNAAQRLAAVRLIGEHADPQTLTILEILLMHPTERDEDGAVRKEAARAVSRLATDAIVPILFEALTDADPDVREWAVQGVAARTGKWFRTDLAVRTADEDWARELELYRKWWGSSSASAAKRSASKALAELYGGVEKGSKVRVARYALPAMDDAAEATWRAGYDLFRALTFVTLGADGGPVAEAERQRVASEAHAWLAERTPGLK